MKITTSIKNDSESSSTTMRLLPTVNLSSFTIVLQLSTFTHVGFIAAELNVGIKKQNGQLPKYIRQEL